MSWKNTLYQQTRLNVQHLNALHVARKYSWVMGWYVLPHFLKHPSCSFQWAVCAFKCFRLAFAEDIILHLPSCRKLTYQSIVTKSPSLPNCCSILLCALVAHTPCKRCLRFMLSTCDIRLQLDVPHSLITRHYHSGDRKFHDYWLTSSWPWSFALTFCSYFDLRIFFNVCKFAQLLSVCLCYLVYPVHICWEYMFCH